jgi:hypothetical protein
MITTYIIEGKSDGKLYGYFGKLHHATYDLKKIFKPNQARILMLKGIMFGEGFHQYQVIYNGEKLIKSKVDENFIKFNEEVTK